MIEVNYELLNEYIDTRVEEKFKKLIASLNLSSESENSREWMDVSETAEYLGLSIKTVYTYSSIKNPDPLPFEKFGGKNRYYKKDLVRWGEKRSMKTLSNSVIDSKIMTEFQCSDLTLKRGKKEIKSKKHK